MKHLRILFLLILISSPVFAGGGKNKALKELVSKRTGINDKYMMDSIFHDATRMALEDSRNSLSTMGGNNLNFDRKDPIYIQYLRTDSIFKAEEKSLKALSDSILNYYDLPLAAALNDARMSTKDLERLLDEPVKKIPNSDWGKSPEVSKFVKYQSISELYTDSKGKDAVLWIYPTARQDRMIFVIVSGRKVLESAVYIKSDSNIKGP